MKSKGVVVRGAVAGASSLENLEARVMTSVSAAAVPRDVLRTPDGAPVVAWAAADMNGDDREDAVLVSGGKVLVLRSRGNGTFRRSLEADLPPVAREAGPGGRSIDLVTGDFDGDGDVDAALNMRGWGERPGRAWRLLNDGSGRLAMSGVTPRAPVFGPAFAFDTDGDGDEEIVRSSGGDVLDFAAGRLIADGSVHEGFPVLAEGRLGDFDGDGDTDIVNVRRNDAKEWIVSLLRNNGAAGFEREDVLTLGAEVWSMEVRLLDLTADGLPEILVSAGAGGFEATGTARLLAVPNAAGTAGGAGVLLFEESVEDARARGGHEPPSSADGFVYLALALATDVRDVDGDGLRDVVVDLESGQSFRHRPTSIDGEWEEHYGLVLIATGHADENGLPTYVRMERGRVDPYRRDFDVLRIHLDGDGAEDALHFREVSSSTEIGVYGTLVYASRSGDPRPIAFDANVPARVWINNGWRIGPSGELKVNALVSGAGIEGDGGVQSASVFIDSNRNGRLDAGDARVSERLSPSADGRWRFRTPRRPSWGSGLATVFIVAEGEGGAASIPAVERVWLA